MHPNEYDACTPAPPAEIVPFRDPTSGATGAIVIHSTALGPAAGGCRLSRYSSEQDAIGDAIRLAEGMALKNALADLPLGGGKAVLREPIERYDRSALFRALGRAVRDLERISTGLNRKGIPGGGDL